MRSLAAALLLALAACGAPADAPPAAQPAQALHIDNAWAPPTPRGVDVSAGYLTITNNSSADDALIGASSARAERVEVHEMTMQDGVMQMRPAARLPISAGDSIALAPGGRHLMFFGVAPPFAEGETIPVRLTLERAGAIDVSLPVRHPSAASPRHDGH